MNRMLFAAVVCLASCMLAESLVCNTCLFSVAGSCVSASTTTCSTNTSVCGTTKFSFSLSGVTCGIKSLGCVESTGCNMTTNATILSVATQTSLTCCTAEKCNTVQSGAPSTRMTLSAALGVALLASVWGSL